MAKTKIEWTEYSWNPVTGCTPVSEGCQNCYAKRMSKRLAGRCGYPAHEPLKVTLRRERLIEPLKWKKPRKVFVCSMGDLFHPDVDEKYIAKVMAICDLARQHTFMLLTKRPDRMKELFNDEDFIFHVGWFQSQAEREFGLPKLQLGKIGHWPPKNIWLGVTAENQQRADERIPILLQTPAAVRFISIEPCLGPVDLASTGALGCTCPPLEGDDGQIEERCSGQCVFYKNAVDKMKRINWVICGGETGPGARPMHPDWVRSLRDQCQDAGVPFFFKQHGEWLHETQGINFHEGHRYYVWPDESMSFRVGKKAAGRLLDGRTWDEMPEIYYEGGTGR